MSAIRYRQGIDQATGRPLVGWPHCRQSLQIITLTVPGELFMNLAFGSDAIGVIGRNLVPSVVLELYRRLIEAWHRDEPEYRAKRLQIGAVTRVGGLTVMTTGLYYPEGRFGNYRIVEAAEGLITIGAGETSGRAA